MLPPKGRKVLNDFQGTVLMTCATLFNIGVLVAAVSAAFVARDALRRSRQTARDIDALLAEHGIATKAADSDRA